MRLATAIWPWIIPAERDRYLARQYVVTAGLTNMRTARPAAVTAWCRAISTGPISPLVLSAFTAGNRLSLTITWREGRFLQEEISAIARLIME